MAGPDNGVAPGGLPHVCTRDVEIREMHSAITEVRVDVGDMKRRYNKQSKRSLRNTLALEVLTGKVDSIQSDLRDVKAYTCGDAAHPNDSMAMRLRDVERSVSQRNESLKVWQSILVALCSGGGVLAVTKLLHL